MAIPPSPAGRVTAAAEAVSKHWDVACLGLDGSAAGGHALRELWAAMQAWTVDYLDRHPHASAQDLMKAAPGIAPENPLSAIALGGDFAVAVHDGQIGDVFVVGLRRGKSAVLWDICSEKPKSRQGRPSAATLPCLWLAYAVVHALPPDGAGNLRFYIAGFRPQIAGATGN